MLCLSSRSNTVPAAWCAIFVLAAACGGPPPLRSSSTPAAPGSSDTLTGTIGEVRPAQRTLQVITGRGYALRAVELRVPSSVPIVWNGEEVPLTAMVRGYIVHVRYRETSSGKVAERIEEITYAPSNPVDPSSGVKDSP